MITILTPTYNRARLLNRAYESLCRQSDIDFEWLIVDDGSSDDTGVVVDRWLSEKKINIRYIYQENSGKAAAFNNGVMNAAGEVCMCLDSDDYLADGAIANISRELHNIENQSIAGIIARKRDTNGHDLGDKFPGNIRYIDTFSLSEEYECYGEWTLIYKTSVLRNFLFPNIENEKFITECVIYDSIAQSYNMLLLDKVIEICEYQTEGYTSNIISNMLKNPTGYKIYYAQRINMARHFRERLSYGNL